MNPFEHRINVRTLPSLGRRETHVAQPDELEPIAARIGVRAVETMRFSAEVKPWRKGGVTVDGHLDGRVVQECVVSLEPITEEIDERFELKLVPEGSKLARPRTIDGEVVLDSEGEDAPETFEGDTVDLAEIWLEFLVLALDPFPRKPDAELDTGDRVPEAESPFARLAALKGKLN